MEIGFVYVIIAVISLALVIAWIILPFAVLGIKSTLEDVLREVKEANKLLRALQPPATVAASPDGADRLDPIKR